MLAPVQAIPCYPDEFVFVFHNIPLIIYMGFIVYKLFYEVPPGCLATDDLAPNNEKWGPWD